MTSNPKRQLWVVFVIVHLVFTAASSVVGGAVVTPLTVAGLIGGALTATGLYVQRKRLVNGSWMVLVGLTLTQISPTGVLVLISGLWTANLVFREKTAELGYEAVSQSRAQRFGQAWWVWFAASAVLFTIGFGALVVLGDGETVTGADDTSLLKGLAWFAWILSWLGAVISAGLGVVLGFGRVIGRHRTRSA